MAYALEIQDIHKVFNRGTINEKVALNGVNLNLNPGDFVTIIGSNGAGKSTLFNAICGSFFTDSGSIYLDGRNITFLPEYQRSRQIGRLFQDPMRGSAPHMTLRKISLWRRPPAAGSAMRPGRKKPPSGKSWLSWTWAWKTG